MAELVLNSSLENLRLSNNDSPVTGQDVNYPSLTVAVDDAAPVVSDLYTFRSYWKRKLI